MRTDMLALLHSHGISKSVTDAMARVHREQFVGDNEQPQAYADRALPIGFGQTISQPLMVAILVDALELKPGNAALDVGTGSGAALPGLSSRASTKIATIRG